MPAVRTERNIVKDATTLLRDMVGDAATNVATRVKPSGEALASIDEPAPDNTWHDKPDISKANVKSQLQSVYKGDPKTDAKDVAESSGNAARRPDGSIDPNAAAQTAADQLDAKIPEEEKEKLKQTTKETAQAYRARTREYLSKKIPEERRERTIWRLKVSQVVLILARNLFNTNASFRKWCLNASSIPTTMKPSPLCLTWPMSMASTASVWLPGVLAQ